MTSYEITCIKRAGGLLLSNHDNITHIGYKDRHIIKVITLQEAIQMLQSKQYAFYVKDKLTQNRITVIVVNQNGLLGNYPTYLRTVANSVETDNLENLPEC